MCGYSKKKKKKQTIFKCFKQKVQIHPLHHETTTTLPGGKEPLWTVHKGSYKQVHTHFPGHCLLQAHISP